MRRSSLHLLIVCILFLAAGCGRQAVEPNSTREPLDRKKLLGTWLLTTYESMYSSASFRPDSQVVLGCRFCDTVFHYRYILTDSSLVFSSMGTREVISNDVVEKLTLDSLRFRTLLRNRSPRSYHK
jgi:hypothetical protein